MKFDFDENIAKQIWVEEAIMYSNINFWCEKNAANKRNWHNWYYRTYNSLEAFMTLFPFWTEKQIRRILANLIKAGLIEKGKFNKAKFDKTNRYTTKIPICPNGRTDETERANPEDGMDEPIPDNKPDIKTTDNIYTHRNEKNIISHNKLTDDIIKQCEKRLKEYTVEEIKMSIDNYTKILNSKKTYFKHKRTLKEFLQRENWMPVFLYKTEEDYISWFTKQPAANAMTEDYKSSDADYLAAKWFKTVSAKDYLERLKKKNDN